MPKQVVKVPGVMRPVGPYSLAVRSGRLLFVSGTAGWDREGRVPPTFREEARLMYENLKAVLASAGGDLSDVLSTTTYLVRASDYPVLNEVRREYFPRDPPTSAVVGVKELMRPELTVEVEAVAELRPRRSRAAGARRRPRGPAAGRR